MGGIVSKPSAPPPAPAPAPAPEPVDTLQMKEKRRLKAQSGAVSSSTGVSGPAEFATKTLLGQ